MKQTGVAAIRDDEFYLDEGNFVLLVENTLFKVHKFVLDRDSSAFQNMFKVCDDEGTDDSHPLVLTDSNVSEFKMLLTILYALPDGMHGHIKRIETSLDDAAVLSAIANKYHFVSTERFALRCLRKLLQKPNVHLVNNLTSDTLRYVFKFISRLNDPDLETDFVRMYAQRVLNGDITPQIVFEFAKTPLLPGLRPILGAAYYVFLMHLKETLPTKNAAVKLGADQGCVHDDLRIRLLTGYWSLVQNFVYLWNELPFSEDTWARYPRLKTWYAKYEPANRSGTADVLALLTTVREELAVQLEELDVGGRDVLAEFDGIVQTFKDNLMDHFDI